MGLGIKHLQTTQEILRIKDILCHTFLRSTTGRLYRTSIENFFIELGMGTDLNLVSHEAIESLTTTSLVKSSFHFLKTHNLELRHDIEIPLPRRGDKVIMQELWFCSPTPYELVALNRCRMHLQPYFLSDLCTGDGLAITEDAWRCNKWEIPSKSSSWP
jgi:hypothetical protein